MSEYIILEVLISLFVVSGACLSICGAYRTFKLELAIARKRDEMMEERYQKAKRQLRIEHIQRVHELVEEGKHQEAEELAHYLENTPEGKMQRKAVK